MVVTVKHRRSRLTAFLLGTALVLGPVAAQTAFAPAAYAQGTKKPKEVKLDRAVAEPLSKAAELAKAGDFKGALPFTDTAAAAAKTPNDKYQVNLMRRAIYANTKNWTKLAETIEAMLASGLMPAGEVATSKRALIQSYDSAGNTAKAISSARDYVNSFGHDKDLTIFVASKQLGAKDYKGAIEWANKAIDGERKAGRSVPEKWYLILLKAQFESKDMNAYFATLEKLALISPKPEYWQQLADRANKEATWSAATYELDKMRLLQAAGVALSSSQRMAMAEAAYSRKLPAETLAILKPMKASGELTADATKAARNQRMFDQATKDAAADAASLAEQAKGAATKPTGSSLMKVAEAYMTTGDNAKAIELYNAAITKGGMTATELNATKLRLGIAQFRAGQKDAAKKTWAGITGTDGGAMLARTWSVVASK